MSAGWRKAWADLRASWSESLQAFAALALGLWGIGSIVIANAILRTDLRSNFLQTRPAHAVMMADGLEKVDLRALPGVAAAEPRDFALLRVEVHQDVWIPLWLFGVRDFTDMRVARVRREQGAFPPPPASMLIERDGRRVSDLDLGGIAHVRAGARLLDVPVSGIAFDPGQAPATQDHFIYAYVDAPTFASLSGTASGHRLLLRLNDVHSRAEVTRRVAALQAWLAERGVTVRNVVVPRFEEHPHQWQLDTLLLLQGAIGLLAFFLGAVLLAQLMAALLARQVRQIAVLKAIGATRAHLLTIQAAMLAAMGAIAGLVALPLAWYMGVAFSRFVGGRLNFDIHPGQVPSLVFVALALASVLMPVVVSLPVLRRALGTSVREGLADHAPQSRAPRRQCALPRFIGSTVALALRNAMRQRRRAAVTVATMALGIAIFDTGFNVRQSLADMLHDFSGSMTHDVQVVLGKPVPAAEALAPFAGLAGVRHVETWNGGRGELQSRVVAGDQGLGVVALPRDTPLFRPRLVSGRWLRADAEVEAVANQQASDLLGHPAVGSDITLTLGGRPVRVRLVGVIEDLDKAKVYLDRDDWDRLANPGHLVNSVMFVAADKRYAGVMALKRGIEAALATSDLDVLYVMSQAERVAIMADHLDIVLSVLVGLSLLVLVVSAVGMAAATGINVRERAKEIGVLRAIGATPANILRLFTLEGMAIGLVSIALGLALAQPMSRCAAVAFGHLMLGEDASLRYAFSTTGLAVVVATTLAFGWIASRIPASIALRLSTRDALAR